MIPGESYIRKSKYYVAVDCVIFGYQDEDLKLLVYPRRFEPSFQDWSLMGGFVQEQESLEMAARRVLKITVGLENLFLKPVGEFSKVDRDPGARVISMAYFALIRIGEHDKKLVTERGGIWFSLDEVPKLVFDHSEMVDSALKKLQRRASYELMGEDLLPEKFTLTQLNNLYNAIYRRSFDAGNFRKKISSLKVLDQLTIKDTSTSKRGAYYYRFKKNAKHLNHDRIVKL
jgi:8-oxo-dGTP diphosphatase